MQPAKFSSVARLVLLGCMVVLAIWLVAGSFSGGESGKPLSVAGVPQQEGSVLAPVETGEPTPIRRATPTPRPDTPTPVPLQPAQQVNHTILGEIAPALDTALSEKAAVNAGEPILMWTWAPTGDKVLYITKPGNLYWSDYGGSNATLLHVYSSDLFDLLSDQRPMGNTLFVTHYGKLAKESREPDHVDIIRFPPGQPPTLEENNTMPILDNIRWWRADRASGILFFSAAGYFGGDKLVTVDANGNVVEERNIPYMDSGEVQPGGEWLVYATSQQVTDTPMIGAEPETVYLLNLRTGQRLQVSPSGGGFMAGNWSPDGNWFLMTAMVDGLTRGVIVSADGQAWITFSGGSGVVWSPDSRHLAYYVQSGGCGEHESPPCTPEASEVYIVNVPERKKEKLDQNGGAVQTENQLMEPRWSPDGSLLGLLSFDPECVNERGQKCSAVTPAYYLMVAR